MTVVPALLVGVGGVLGALSRHLLGEGIDGTGVDTLVVNIIGSFVLGVLLATPVDESLFLVFGTGFCGAFTTFSTFAFETVRLAESGRGRQAAANAVVHLVGAVLAVLAGTAVVGPLL